MNNLLGNKKPEIQQVKEIEPTETKALDDENNKKVIYI